MNTSELVEEVSGRAGLGRKDVADVLSKAIQVITETLRAGGDVRIQNLGTFSIADTKAKQGRNPRTGEPIEIAAARKIKFGVGKAMKDGVARSD